MVDDAAKAEKAVAATAAGMLGGFESDAKWENREGAGMEKALAPFLKKPDVDDWMRDLDRAELGGFNEHEAGVVEGAASVVGRAGKEFRQMGRVDRVSPGKVERALSEAHSALNMQMTSDAPDMRVIEMPSSLSSQLVQVKQQLANQAQQFQSVGRQGAALRGMWQGPTTGATFITPFAY